ncbi:MAG: SUMF1/EgtB/PvdO family nonheme iron enzyme [Planctomycetota bacterium]|nr:SUMF1/EgtB/PvdO family nonheme iron enzyme [Planctomycetota bacterium]
MLDPSLLAAESVQLAVRNEIDRICDRFEADWRADGVDPRIEDVLAKINELRNIPRDFAIGTTEVTVQEFERFLADKKWRNKFEWVDPKVENLLQGGFDYRRPCQGVSWHVAAAYCNWISEKEHIPEDQWCYEPNSDGVYALGMKSVDDLSRTGYRLPTHAEWEYACHAGAGKTHKYFGFMGINGQYESMNEKLVPVALLKPNDFGL